MTDILSIGSTGLKAYSKALGTIADNVANAQTPGYARRTLALAEAPSTGGMLLYRGSVTPAGVEVRGVVRSVDQWLIDDARVSNGDAGRTGTKLEWMLRVESALSNDNNSIATGLTNVFTSADLLAADPGNPTLRGQFLTGIEEVANGFRVASGQLTRLNESVGQASELETLQLNSDLVALQDINTALRKARDGTTNQANLLDQRDKILDSISTKTNVKVSFDQRGVAEVRSADSGDLMVGPDYTAQISATVAADGRINYMLDGTTPFVSSSGTLAGFSEASYHIADQLAGLDAKAMEFGDKLNTAHQAGFDKDGNPGLALFQGTNAATLMAAALTTAQVAAADATTSNGNILALGGMRGEGNPEASWSAHLAAQAQLTAAARAQNAAASTRSEGANAARDMVSEVDLDREAADLLRFQQAYSASARTIQVAREIMQTLLSSL